MSVDRLPLTDLPAGGLPPAALVCGDPARASQIAHYLQDRQPLADQREYRSFCGRFQGAPVAVCSHGIGAPGAAIAFEELIAAGARRLIRVGTCGGLQADLQPGDLIVATAAVQNTGYGRETVPPGFPAVADLDLTLALRQAAQTAGRSVRMGIILTRDNFYRGLPLPDLPDYQQLAAAGVLAVEMECAALFLVGALRQARTAAILVVDGNVLHSGGEKMASYQPRQAAVLEATEAAIHIALHALQASHDLS